MTVFSATSPAHLHDLGHRSIHRHDLTPIDTSKFYIVTAISNAVRFKSRYNLYRKFAKHVEESNGQLVTVEMAFGERPFEITHRDNPLNIQLRASTELWHKENMLNVAISRLPQDWQYVAWVDADIDFQRSDWVQETVHQLQHHAFVQMFSTALDLGPPPELAPLGFNIGFAYCYLNQDIDQAVPKLILDGALNHKRHNQNTDDHYGQEQGGRIYWHPGYAWAARRDAIEHVGGLLDTGVLGAGDHHMSLSMIGHAHEAMPPNVTEGYKRAVMNWQARCDRHIRKNIGYVPGVITHGWHGKKANRKYWDRWKILANNKFDPYHDLKKDWQGLWQLIDHGEERSLQLRDQIRAYFRQRNEDGTDS